MVVPKVVSKNSVSTAVQNSYIEAATADNTRRAYQSDITHFKKWGGLLPSSSQDVLSYLHDYAESLNPRTLQRRLVSIRNWHTYQHYEDPTSDPFVKKTMLGIRRIHGKPKNKARALMLEHLTVMTNFMMSRGKFTDYRNIALVQIGFFGAFRRSELINIRYEDINFVANGVELLVRRSKTDQNSEGEICAIQYGRDELCAVTHLKNWLEISKIKSGYIFTRIKEQTICKDQLSSRGIPDILKTLAKKCNINDVRFSGHSLRRGLATEASMSGATVASIMRQGRWHSPASVLEYIEEGDRFRDNAVNTILFK